MIKDKMIFNYEQCYHIVADLLAKTADELDKTKQALGVAVKGLKHMRGTCLSYAADYMDAADNILKQITALEQKDK